MVTTRSSTTKGGRSSSSSTKPLAGRRPNVKSKTKTTPKTIAKSKSNTKSPPQPASQTQPNITKPRTGAKTLVGAKRHMSVKRCSKCFIIFYRDRLAAHEASCEDPATVMEGIESEAEDSEPSRIIPVGGGVIAPPSKVTLTKAAVTGALELWNKTMEATFQTLDELHETIVEEKIYAGVAGQELRDEVGEMWRSGLKKTSEIGWVLGFVDDKEALVVGEEEVSRGKTTQMIGGEEVGEQEILAAIPEQGIKCLALLDMFKDRIRRPEHTVAFANKLGSVGAMHMNEERVPWMRPRGENERPGKHEVTAGHVITEIPKGGIPPRELLDKFRGIFQSQEETDRFVEMAEALTIVEKVGEKEVTRLREEWRAMVGHVVAGMDAESDEA